MSRFLKNLHKPCDQLDKYDDEPYMKNPLLKLTLSEIRKHRRQSPFEQSTAKVSQFSCCPEFALILLQNKIRSSRESEDDEDNTPNPSVHPHIHINKLRFYARNTPIPKMLKSTEQKIIRFSEKRLRDKYPGIVKEYMAE